MVKNILYMILGVLAGGAIIYLVESLGHLFYPQPDNLDPTDLEALKQHIMQLPVGAFLFVLLAYALGSFGGGMVTALLSKKHEVKTAMVAGGILMIFGLINLLMIPHPIWFTVVSLILYIPCAYLGGSAAIQRKRGSSLQKS